MAESSRSLKNCRILIRDSATGTLLADTNIEDFDSRRNTLVIRRDALKGPAEDKLSLLVLSRNGVLEYSGNLRKTVMATDVEIAIFGEKKKEDRNFTRYEMKAEGHAEAIVVEEKRIDLRKPLTIAVQNISANGILFRADVDAFRKGSQVRLRIGLKDNALVSEYEIVRTQNRNKETAEYGCRNILPEGEREGAGAAPRSLKGKKTQDGFLETDGGEFLGEDAKGKEISYDVLQQHLEQHYGYTGWLKRLIRLQEMGSVNSASNKEDVEKLTDDIYTQLRGTDSAVLLNCVHRKRPEQEKRGRHALNLALLGGLMGLWLQLQEPMIKKLIKMGLREQTNEPETDKGHSLALYFRIMSVAELYDERAAHPNHEKAGIPLVFLEQMRYGGMNQPTGSVKMLEWVMAENILHCISHRNVLLADHSIGKLLYILPNDMGHPILSVNGRVYQETEPWNLLWIAVKPADGAEKVEEKNLEAD